MNTFKVNGREYKAKPFDFNLVCDLEDLGISLSEAQNKPMSLVRAYFGICADGSKEDAGREMEQHLMNGGSLEDIMQAMSKEMSDSDFFRSLNKSQEKNTQETPSKTRKTTEA